MPVADDAMTGELPTYRDLWLRIRDGLPKKGAQDRGGRRRAEAARRARRGARQPLRATTNGRISSGSRTRRRTSTASTPPVFIVVCNNTNVSKLVFDYIAGWEKTLPDGQTRVRRRAISRSSATSMDGRWTARPEHDPGRQRATRIRRGDERRVQEDRRRARSRSSRRSTASASPAATPRADRRGPAARGDEHRRQAGQARRAREVRRLRLDAHRRLGRQHRHPHPGRAGVRHATAVRAGGRPRAAADELRA